MTKFKTKQAITDTCGQGLQGTFIILDKVNLEGRFYYIIKDADNIGNNMYLVHFTEVIANNTVKYLAD